jgi:hypothetical protein
VKLEEETALKLEQASGGKRRPERHQRARMAVVETPSEGKPSMGKSIQKLSSITRVGLDLAKKVFQVHAVDANGEIVVARKLAHAREFRGNVRIGYSISARLRAALRAAELTRA